MTTETLKNGLHTTYHDNGQLDTEANFKGGKKDGKQTWWDENEQKKIESFLN